MSMQPQPMHCAIRGPRIRQIRKIRCMRRYGTFSVSCISDVSRKLPPRYDHNDYWCTWCIRADNVAYVARRRGYSDHFVTIYVCVCGFVRCGIKREPPIRITWKLAQ